MPPTLDAALLIAAVLAGAFVSGLAGFAFSALAGAIALHVLPPLALVPLLLLCSLTTQLFSLHALRSTLRIGRAWPFLAGGLIGVPAGAELLHHLEPRLFRLGFGVLLVAYAAYGLARPAWTGGRFGGWRSELAVGAIGGLAGGLIALPGAFPTVWCSLRGMTKDEQRSVVQPFIVVMQTAAALYLLARGSFGHDTLVSYLWCLPAVAIGTALGVRAYRHVDERAFRRTIFVLLAICGAGLLA